MSEHSELRRQFLQSGATLLGASWLALNSTLVLAAARDAHEASTAAAGFKHITAGQAAELAAIADQIVPADESPSASEIGVVFFIDAALGGFMAGGATNFKQGLADLQQKVGEAYPHKGMFSDLSFAEQTTVLESIEDTRFFTSVYFLTLCGVLTLPRYGGNRDNAGWDLLGFDHRHAWQPPFGYYDAAIRDNKS